MVYRLLTALLAAALLPDPSLQQLNPCNGLGYRRTNMYVFLENSENVYFQPQTTTGHQIVTQQVQTFVDTLAARMPGQEVFLGVGYFLRSNSQDSAQTLTQVGTNYAQISSQAADYSGLGRTGARLIEGLKLFNANILPGLLSTVPTFTDGRSRLELVVVYASPPSSDSTTQNELNQVVTNIRNQGVTVHLAPLLSVASSVGNIIPFFNTAFEPTLNGLADNLLSLIKCDVVTISPECTDCIIRETSGFIRDKDRCDKFTRCYYNLTSRAIESTTHYCKHNTLFDRRYGICNNAWSVLEARGDTQCSYCSSSKTKFPYRYSCEAYYECSVDDLGRQTLVAKCCPRNMRYDDSRQECVQDFTSPTCVRGRYKDWSRWSSTSCRQYLSCEVENEGATVIGTCGENQMFVEANSSCVASTQCSECDIEAVTGRPCMFVKLSGVNQVNPFPGQYCPSKLGWNQAACSCDYPDNIGVSEQDLAICHNTKADPRAFTNNCRLTLYSHQDEPNNVRSFEDHSGQRREINNYGVVFENGRGIYDGNSYIIVPHFSGNYQEFRKGVWAQVKFRPSSQNPGRQVVMSNAPCNDAIVYKIIDTASLSIEVDPSINTVYFTAVAFANFQTSFTYQTSIQWPNTISADQDITATMSFDSNGLNAHVAIGTFTDRRNDPAKWTAPETPHEIVPTLCGLKYGKGSDTERQFTGTIDHLMLVTQCQPLPDVSDIPNPVVIN